MDKGLKLFLMNFKKTSIITIFFILLMILASSIKGSNIPKSYIFTFDKVIHFIEYGCLGTLLIFMFARASKYPIYAALTVGVLYSFIDELYQSTVFGRSSSVFDVIADVVGLAFSVIIVKFLFKSYLYD